MPAAALFLSPADDWLHCKATQRQPRTLKLAKAFAKAWRMASSCSGTSSAQKRAWIQSQLPFGAIWSRICYHPTKCDPSSLQNVVIFIPQCSSSCPPLQCSCLQEKGQLIPNITEYHCVFALFSVQIQRKRPVLFPILWRVCLAWLHRTGLWHCRFPHRRCRLPVVGFPRAVS